MTRMPIVKPRQKRYKYLRPRKAQDYKILPIANNDGVVHWQVWEISTYTETRRGGDFRSREAAENHIKYLRTQQGPVL
jgi:hypothetical protein